MRFKCLCILLRVGLGDLCLLFYLFRCLDFVIGGFGCVGVNGGLLIWGFMIKVAFTLFMVSCLVRFTGLFAIGCFRFGLFGLGFAVLFLFVVDCVFCVSGCLRVWCFVWCG